MKTLILFFIITSGWTFSQTCRIESITGSVKVLDQNDKWIDVKEGAIVSGNSLIVAGNNSSVKISSDAHTFILRESSAVQVSDIKQMTLDELLLALALEDIMNAPRKKENNNGKTTAVYGEKHGSVEKILLSDEFGIKRIKGAVQLAENGFKESSVVTAKEVFRKYPGINQKAEYRIYFADLLYNLGLYEEAYEQFVSINKMELTESENTEVKKMISDLNKKLLN